MNEAIGYVRVSTEEQSASGLGLADQCARVRSYCELKGFRLKDIVEDKAISGGGPLAKRPGGSRLVRALRKREAAHVVMLKLDRGFRHAADCLATVEAWERQRVTLHIIDLGGAAIDTACAAGKFMLTVLAGAAEMERNLTRERTRAALHVKRRRGERISRYAPFGHRLDEDGNLETDGREQRIVQLIHYLRGKGMSLRGIAKVLEGREMHGRNGQPVSAKTVHAILRRPMQDTCAG